MADERIALVLCWEVYHSSNIYSCQADQLLHPLDMCQDWDIRLLVCIYIGLIANGVGRKAGVKGVLDPYIANKPLPLIGTYTSCTSQVLVATAA